MKNFYNNLFNNINPFWRSKLRLISVTVFIVSILFYAIRIAAVGPKSLIIVGVALTMLGHLMRPLVNRCVKIKVYLDDERETPAGYKRTYTVEETISLLKTQTVSVLSLDNDLGLGLQEGYKVLDFLEQEVYLNPSFPMPKVYIHSANASRVRYMQSVIKKIMERQNEK